MTGRYIQINVLVLCSSYRPLASSLLYGLVIIRLQRRHLVWINVTTNPTADWIARQIPREARGGMRPGRDRIKSLVRRQLPGCTRYCFRPRHGIGAAPEPADVFCVAIVAAA
jgi:hypothetical protein